MRDPVPDIREIIIDRKEDGGLPSSTFLNLAPEKQEKLLAGLEEQVAAASADYQELSHLLEEKEREDAVLSDLMEQWESAADLLG